MLNVHRYFSGEAVLRTVDVRFEHDTVIVHDCSGCFHGLHVELRVVRVGCTGKLLGEHLLETSTQRKNLEAAGVRVGGSWPVHEFAESAGLVNEVRAGL